MVQSKTFLFFTKARLLVVTESKIIVANSKTKQVRFINKVQDVLGITKSIRIGATNFIMHIKQTADEEWFCDKRDEVIKVLAERYQAVMNKTLPVYGLGCASLEDYLTTEKDIQRRITNIPSDDYLISKKSSIVRDNTEDEWEDDEELFDDFIVLERPNFDKYNSETQLDKETNVKNDGHSMCLIGKPGLHGEVVTLEDFEIQKVIDKGSFGKVFLVYNRKMNKTYAMKRINKDLLLQKKQVQNIKNEKDILFQADHPFVNSMDFVFHNDLRIYFFLKYLPGGNIYDNIYQVKRFSEQTVKFIGAQIVLALGYLHERGIVHRDLKPENVLMDADGYISLADFGLAKFLEKQDQTYSFCGTAEYLAPEILNMTGHSFSVDWWTLGILMYEMATGRPPFLNKSHHKLGLLIRTGKIVFPDPEKHKIYMSDNLRDLILKLLERDATKRLGTVEDMKEVKEHPFFADMDWDALLRKEIQADYIPQLNQTKDLDGVNQNNQESKLIDVSQNNQSAAAAMSTGSSLGAKALGHSILEEDERDQLSQQQKDYVRLHADKFKNF